MKNYYYIFWSDAIQRAKATIPKGGNWIRFSFFMYTYVHSLNLFLIYVWLKYFGIIEFPILKIEITGFNAIDTILSFSIQFAGPPLIVNYFFVFFRKRYEKIIIKYPIGKTKVAGIYAFSVIIGTFFSVILSSTLK